MRQTEYAERCSRRSRRLLLPSYREKRQSPIVCGERNVDSTRADGTTISSPKPVISLSGGGAQDAHGETGVHRNAALTGDKMKRIMEELRSRKQQHGGMGYVLLWLLGVPIPVLILISLLRGCA
jgi:hypothetical protein